jgi:hypothetical protein
MNARAHTHTCYGVDAFSTYALVAVPFGVSYSPPLCKALDIFIALALHVKVHVVPTCIAESPFSERESERQGGGTERDRKRLAASILVNGDEEVGINTVCLCVVCCLCGHLLIKVPPAQVLPASGVMKPYPLASRLRVSQITPFGIKRVAGCFVDQRGF